MKSILPNQFIGKRFGRLLVLSEGVPKKRSKSGVRYTVFCECECGNKKEYLLERLRSGLTKSCGCLQREIASSIGKVTGNLLCKRGKEHPFYGLYGDKSPSRKGGIRLYMTIRNSNEYKLWRDSIFKRDDYMCFVSGKRGVHLEVHHITPLNSLLSGVTHNNFRENSILWDMGNGITISREVHRIFHKKYGKKNIGINDLLDFKKQYNVSF